MKKSSSSREHTRSALFICTPKGNCNVDVHSLFYNVLSKKTYTFEGDCCKGLRVNAERIATLVCCNMDSCEKFPLCLQEGQNNHARSCHCSEHLWMAWEIFLEFMVHLSRGMASNKKIIRFGGCRPAHLQDAGNLQQEEFLCAFQGSYRLLLLDTVTFLVIGCSLFNRQTIVDFFF